MSSSKQFQTKVVHAGNEPCKMTGAVMPPVYFSTTYVQSSPGVHQGYEYSRTANPTRDRYQACVAELENASYGLAFASGMAAIDCIFNLLHSGDMLIANEDLYGGTHRHLTKIAKANRGIAIALCDLTSPNSIDTSLLKKARMIFIETPSNPTLQIIDIEKIATIAKTNDCLLVVDNTFATPYLQQPLTIGADIVVHSATKYLNGHSDVINGVIAVNKKSLAESLAFYQNAIGAIASPFDSYMCLRGIKTLALRMAKHCDNAMAVASWLAKHPKVERVVYPGLDTHPQHQLAKRQMRAFGGIVSFYIKGNQRETVKTLEKLELFSLAESLGGVESLIEHPDIMTHAQVATDMKAKLGISDNLIRLSAGIEDHQDLIDDLERALQ